MRENAEIERQDLYRAEDPGQEELWEDYEGEDLVRCALAAYVTQDQDAESATEEADYEGDRDETEHLDEGQGNSDQEPKEYNHRPLHERYERLATDLAEDDGVA